MPSRQAADVVSPIVSPAPQQGPRRGGLSQLWIVLNIEFQRLKLQPGRELILAAGSQSQLLLSRVRTGSPEHLWIRGRGEKVHATDTQSFRMLIRKFETGAVMHHQSGPILAPSSLPVTGGCNDGMVSRSRDSIKHIYKWSSQRYAVVLHEQ